LEASETSAQPEGGEDNQSTAAQTGQSQVSERPFKQPEAIYSDDKHFKTVAKAIAALLATLFPSVIVVVLYTIQNLKARLAAIAAFSFLLAVTLSVFTTAKPSEIFAITAA
jgi:hypothetical protein